jgi:hypothetical protein
VLKEAVKKEALLEPACGGQPFDEQVHLRAASLPSRCSYLS